MKKSEIKRGRDIGNEMEIEFENGNTTKVEGERIK